MESMAVYFCCSPDCVQPMYQNPWSYLPLLELALHCLPLPGFSPGGDHSTPVVTQCVVGAEELGWTSGQSCCYDDAGQWMGWSVNCAGPHVASRLWVGHACCSWTQSLHLMSMWSQTWTSSAILLADCSPVFAETFSFEIKAVWERRSLRSKQCFLQQRVMNAGWEKTLLCCEQSI